MTPRRTSPRKPRSGTLSSMPDEVLLKIWLLLAEPQELALVCKSIRDFTQRADVRAQYFVSRYGRYLAMFHAIARPNVFDEALCKSLVDFGAHISLALMQELSKRWFAFGYARTDSASKDKWCLNLSFSAVLAVLSQGAKRFPKLNVAKTSEMDLFSDWLNGRNGVTRDDLMNMFLKRRFTPLPLRNISFGGYGGPLITVEKITAVADCMVAQRDADKRKRKRRRHEKSSGGSSEKRKRRESFSSGSSEDRKRQESSSSGSGQTSNE